MHGSARNLSHYVFAWYTSCVALCMAIPRLVIPCIAIPNVVANTWLFHAYYYEDGSITEEQLHE